jgi:cytochrome d ubiquinol oxidase subunit II
MDSTFFQSACFFILLAVLIMYSILDSFDLGIGMIIPFTKDPQKKKLLFASITPYWDGNEVWLIIAGGLLFAVFPQAFATILSGFYIPVVLLMVALIFRAMSIEFWHTSQRSKKIWEWTFFAGSILIVFVLCVALGNAVGGIPLDSTYTFKGSFFSLFGMLPRTLAILGISTSILQGLIFASKKIRGFNAEVKIFTITWCIVMAIFVIMIALFITQNPHSISNVLFWVFSILIIVFLITVHYFWNKNLPNTAFIFSSATIALVWLLLASVHYPRLVLNSLSSGNSITIATGNTDIKTLGIVFTVALSGIVLFFLLTFLNYKIFRGEVTEKEGYSAASPEEISNDRKRTIEQPAKSKL